MDGLYDQLRIALHSVWRRRWLALGVAWTLCLVGWLAIALMPNSYQAKAKVMLDVQPMLNSAAPTSAIERQNNLALVRQGLTSTSILENIVRRTDLNLQVASDLDLAEQVTTLRENIKVTAQPDDVFEITADAGYSGFSNGQNARAAEAIIKNLLDLFVEQNLAGSREDSGRTLAFLDEELKRREAELREAEQRRVDFETRFLGALPGDGSMSQRLAMARSEMADLDQQMAAANSALAALRGQLSGTPATLPSIGAGGQPSGYAGQLAQLEGQLSGYLAKGWTDRHPDVAAVRQQIDRVRPRAAAEQRSGGGGGGTANPAYITLRSMAAEKEATLAAAGTRKAQIQASLAELNARQTAEPEVAAEQARLNRDYEVLKRQYDKLLEDREQLRIRSDANSKTSPLKLRVIQAPSLPTSPYFPNRPLFLTGILIVALGAGVAAAFAKGQLQTTFPTAGRLEAVTGLPVLGSVSEVVTSAVKADRRQKLTWFAGAGGALAGSYVLLMLVEFWQRSTVA